MRFLAAAMLASAISIFGVLPAHSQQAAPMPPTQKMRDGVEIHTHDYFAMKDLGELPDAYNFFSDGLKTMLPFDRFRELVEQFRTNYGTVQSRRITRTTWYDNPISAPPGIYAAVDFTSHYEETEIVCGYLIWLLQPDDAYILIREETNAIPKQVAESVSPQKLAELKLQFGCRGD